MKNLLIKIFQLRRIEKKLLIYFIDLIFCIFSLCLSIIFLDMSIEVNFKNLFFLVLLVFSFTFFYAVFGIYNTISRFFGLKSLLMLIGVNLFNLVFCFGFVFLFFTDLNFLYFSLYLIFLFTFFTSFVRLFFVFLINYFNSNPKNSALVYGAGYSGVKSMQFLKKNFNIVAFIDDDISKIGNKIDNIPILSFETVINLDKFKNISNLFICINDIGLKKRKQIIKKVSSYNFNLKFLEPYDREDEYVSNLNFRKVEFSELIDRDINWSKKDIFNVINSKTVLVTGAAGSIGSELVNQIIKYSPKKIILIDNSEFNLYNLSQQINNNYEKTIKDRLIYKLVSINQFDELEGIFDEYNPELVFHTAAFKHVPLVELDPFIGIKNNFISTIKLCELGIKYEIEKFIYISTDKAVRPSSVMGLSKRLSEIYIQCLKRENKLNSKQNFIIVRFGNVFGSNGSVVPLFTKQIERGGPITVTHKDVSRYFMSIYEAVGLILECTTFINSKDIFLLEMGQEIKIIDLAKKMIKLSGLEERNSNNPDGDIEIKITGLRSGEKIHEELIYDNITNRSSNKHVLITNEKIDSSIVSDILIKKINHYLDIKDLEKIKEFAK